MPVPKPVPCAIDPAVISMATRITELHGDDPEKIAQQKVAIAGMFLVICDCAARDGNLAELLREGDLLRTVIAHPTAPRKVLIDPPATSTAREIPRA
jgi:hypothetical protein